MTYAEKLKDPRWQKRRLEIMQRDNFSCVHCYDSESTLNVHHRIYRKNTMPWDYEDLALETVCESCHKFLSGISEELHDLLLMFTDGYEYHLTGALKCLLRHDDGRDLIGLLSDVASHMDLLLEGQRRRMESNGWWREDYSI